MEVLLHNVYSTIVNNFPELNVIYSDIDELPSVTINSPNNSAIGALILQVSKDNQIWIRNFHPFTAYPIDSIDEMVRIIGGIIHDEIHWAIGYNNNKWYETTLFNYESSFEKEENIIYKVISWSGKTDQNIDF